MNENDIIKRLGFENSSELADLLGIDIVFCDKMHISSWEKK